METINQDHVFWQHLPAERKTKRALLILRARRFWAWMKGRSQRIALLTGLYIITWSLPILAGQSIISLFALIPLMVVPPVGFLIYQLVWKEFHE